MKAFFLARPAAPRRADSLLARVRRRISDLLAATGLLADLAIGLEQGFYWLLPDEVDFLLAGLLGPASGQPAGGWRVPPHPARSLAPEVRPWRGARRSFPRSAT